MNYNDTINYIHSLGNFSLPPTLERMKKVLKKLNNPQNDFKAIHIAGTNGKGSVAAMLNSVLISAGYKTGLFISPFIIDFCERIQVGGEFISHNDLCRISQTVIETGIKLTEFEFITVVAFVYFCEQKCQFAVIETGLGGRLDATNILTNVMVDVITKIGLDHTAVLGDSIEKIAYEKSGIIKDCPVVVSLNQPNDVLRVLKKYNPVIPNNEELKVLKSNVFGNEFIYKGEYYKTSLPGGYQIENALSVIETAKILGIDYDNIKTGLNSTFFPARLEIISEKPIVILDGAHNPDGAFVLSQIMKNYNGKITAIIGMCKDKDCEAVLKQTLPYCKRAIAVRINGLKRTIDSEELKVIADKYCNTKAAKTYDEAICDIKDEDVIFVFGSLYLASDIRPKLKNFFKV